MMDAVKNDAKKIFRKKGTCSQTLCYLLNREFGRPRENEERATDPLAGGIMQRGQQCGMLWGASLAAGAESWRRHADRDQAMAGAIAATQRLMESFVRRTGSADCREITGCDWRKPFSIAKYMLSGKMFACFDLAATWAPEAIATAGTDLARAKFVALSRPPLNCASEVVRKMGASDEEMVMVAGFAGGLGLSGNGCGALAAAIWMNVLAWCRKHPGKRPPYFRNPEARKALRAFDAATGAEILCRKICGRDFKTLDEHAEFIEDKGCAKLLDALAQA
jgi:hypothetical protein